MADVATLYVPALPDAVKSRRPRGEGGMTSQNPASCSECARLAVQAGAALLTGDKSRQADVRVLQSRHHAAAHADEPEQSHQVRAGGR